jgi:hypothetical protein
MKRAWPVLFVLALVWGCASNSEKSSTQPMGEGKSSSASKSEFDKPGFVTAVDKKNPRRLWVFKEGSKDLEEFRKSGEPAKNVTYVGAGTPKGMTMKSGDRETIDAYLAAK